MPDFDLQAAKDRLSEEQADLTDTPEYLAKVDQLNQLNQLITQYDFLGVKISELDTLRSERAAQIQALIAELDG